MLTTHEVKDLCNNCLIHDDVKCKTANPPENKLEEDDYWKGGEVVGLGKFFVAINIFVTHGQNEHKADDSRFLFVHQARCFARHDAFVRFAVAGNNVEELDMIFA